MFELVDLHTHSTCSDGTLTPAELVAAAASRAVRTLALTDHDTLAGLPEAAAACAAADITFIPGVEITTLWRGQEIHIVGLGVDANHPGLVSHLAQVVSLRRERIAAIGERLLRVPRLAQLDLAGRALRSAQVPTRTHLARELVTAGAADSVQEAFDRYLGRSSQGHVPACWGPVDEALAAIRAAGGHAALAHPHRYKLSAGGLRSLVGEFAQWGGEALEVSLPGLSPDNANRLASLARSHGLAGSVGSDFHEPGLPWRPLGRFAKLPEGIEPLLPRLLAA